MTEPGPDPFEDVAEADRLEQAAVVGPAEDVDLPVVPPEASEADLWEQARPVPGDEDDYPRE